MLPDLSRRELALLSAVVFLILAIVLVVTLQQVAVTDSAVIIAILLLPVLVYLAVSGDVAEIGGPGGFKAKFREIADAPVETRAEVEDLQIVGKADMTMLETRAQALSPGVPVALSFHLGDSYDPWMTEQYIELLQRIDPDLTVAFIDDQGRFQASTDAAKIRSIINNDHFGAQMQDAIQQSSIPLLRHVLALSTTSCTQTSTNAEALDLMLADGVKSLIVVDATRHPVGVVRRDDIVAKMLARLART